MTKKELRCPGCSDADEVRRSHMRPHDWPLRLIGLRPYRCLLCNHRFHSWVRGPLHRHHAEEVRKTA